VRVPVSLPVRVRADAAGMHHRLPPVLNRPLLAGLDREWHALNRCPDALQRARGWGLGVPFRTLDDVVLATGFRTQPVLGAVCQDRVGDSVLAALLRAARTDVVAARVVLQRLLPGLLSRASRWGTERAGGSTDPFDELLSVAWTVIREFPLDRRPRHLASNLLRDTEAAAFAKVARRTIVIDLTPTNSLDVPVEEEADEDPKRELAAVLAAAGALSESEMELLELLLQGHSQLEVATLLSVSERTVRNHRDAIVHRLRRAALAAA
jgi:DNA-binding CsgD family transcriptional regulator